MWGQCTGKLSDKLETSPMFTFLAVAKDVIAHTQMIWVQVHKTMDTCCKKAWTVTKAKLLVLNFIKC